MFWGLGGEISAGTISLPTRTVAGATREEATRGPFLHYHIHSMTRYDAGMRESPKPSSPPITGSTGGLPVRLGHFLRKSKVNKRKHFNEQQKSMERPDPLHWFPSCYSLIEFYFLVIKGHFLPFPFLKIFTYFFQSAQVSQTL